MSDTSVNKIDSTHSPKGELGQKYLASGKSISMRLWEDEQLSEDKEPTSRDYETVGYVINRHIRELTLKPYRSRVKT